MDTILVVEDNRLEQERIRECFEGHYELFFVAEAAAVRGALRARKPDLVLLDVTLPDGDGYEIFQSMRDEGLGTAIPVIFLTGRDQPQDKVRAFSMGAEDYVVKPFEPLELRARVEARLTRRRRDVGEIERGPLSFDPSRLRVSLGEYGPLDLTPNEFRVLFCLAVEPGRARSREELLDALWGDTAVTPRTIDTHIYSIRGKLREHRSCIETVSRVGYRFREKPDDSV